MSTSIRGYIPKREGSARIRSSKGTPVYECSYSWIVEATSKTEDYLAVLSTTGLPIVGVTTDPTGIAVCTGKNATRRTDNPLIWDVTCDFSSEVDDRSGSGDSGGPGGEKYWQYSEPITKDIHGDLIANSAAEAFPTTTLVTRFLPMWEFFQIESAAITDEQILNRCDVVNKNKFKGREPKTLLCTVLSSVIGRYYGSLRRLTQYQLKYKPDEWTLKKADIGTRWLTAPPRELRDYTIDPDGNGSIINGPLDGDGNKVDDGKGPAAIIEFDIYTEVSFSTFLRI
jgi:hypothetical protein